jgi:hypothetical protein
MVPRWTLEFIETSLKFEKNFILRELINNDGK